MHKVVPLLGLFLVCGGFGIFQLNGGAPSLPPGVTTHAIDGGPNYMTNHSLTTATASFTFNGPTCSSGCTYSTGWDSPNWFMFSNFLGYFRPVATFSATQSNCTITAGTPAGGNIAGGTMLSGAPYTNEIISFFSGSGGLGTYPLSAVSTVSHQTITGGTSGAHAIGSIGCNILTLESTLTGTFTNGETITGSGVTGGTTISFGSGNGVAGTYQGSVSQSQGSASVVSSDPIYWQSLGINSTQGFSAPDSGQLARVQTAGIQNNMLTQYMGNVIANDRKPGAETPGMDLWDEPQAVEQLTAQIQGYSSTTFTGSSSGFNFTVGTTPTGGVPILGSFWQFAGLNNNGCGAPPNGSGGPGQCMVNSPFLSDGGVHITANTFYLCTTDGFAGGYGVCSNGAASSLTFGSETVTQIAYPGYNTNEFSTGSADTRFYSVGMAGLTFLNSRIIASASGNVTAANFYAQAYTSPGGHTRYIDMTGIDQFMFVISRGQGLQTYNQAISNVWDNSGTARMATQLEGARGGLYGDIVDMQRSFQSTRKAIGGLEANGIMIWNDVETGDAKGGLVNYAIQPVEMGWGVWSSIIHGARGIAWFDNDGGSSGINILAQENIYSPYYQSAQSATFTGSISGNLLTVTSPPIGSGNAGAGLLAPGMVATSGVTCASPPCMIAAQLGEGSTQTASFNAAFSGTNSTTMTVTGISGTIIIPSILAGTPTVFDLNNQPILITAGPGGNGVYTVTANANGAGPFPVQAQETATFTGVFSGAGQKTLTISGLNGTVYVPSSLSGAGVGGTAGGSTVAIRAVVTPGSVYTVDANSAAPTGTIMATPAFGGQGVYKITSGTGSGSMTFQQQYARGNNSPAAMSMTGMLTELHKQTKDLAPVIQSPFAYGYVSTSPAGYRLEDGMTQQGSIALYSFAWLTTQGIETMAKYFTGTPYTASTGETIGPGFYVFADTRYTSDTLSPGGTVTFTLGTSGCNNATLATVIGESRTRSISGCTFTDTFNNAWSSHVYKIQ